MWIMYQIFGIVLCLNIEAVFGQNTDHGIENGSPETPIANQNSMNQIHNHTAYIDRAENLIRLPQLNQSEDHKIKKNIKKPKRTVQKIIKKNKSRPKKFYVYHVTSRTTQKPQKTNTERLYDESLWKENWSTTQSHMKKRLKKWNAKLPRNPMPFKKMQYKKDLSKRSRREVRDDVFILKDLDEMRFLSKKSDDYDIVNAHFKNYW